MRISELSRTGGVPVATVKYYLRTGLLHEGRRTSATQAQYDETHATRLRLIRALIGVGGLSIAATRAVLDQLDDPPESMHELLGMAHDRLKPADQEDVDTAAAEALVREMGWQIDGADPASLHRLAEALAAIDAADFTLPPGRLRDYADVMQALADLEVGDVPTESRDAAVHYVVLGTILAEPLLLALRRLAQINASSRRFAAGAREPRRRRSVTS
ncbi:MAG: MerR family transcriptional regulator [Streptosporangiales bacterium]|nr:MerR family transcriptional regulator [Streptosporangiales bacterium]